ncbi:MAG: 50S ribosomal protein L32 [Bacteriovoracaceae bacterium]|nr:50S ribosomal protein L32 [Bacteriovoracaceae bacterium]
MAVPKKKTSVSRKGKRRAGQTHKLSRKHPMSCPNCGDMTMPHTVCASCGTYKGKEVITIKAASEEETAE